MDLAQITTAAVELFHHHQPWLQDKAGAALITQSVREAWEQIKKRLTSPAATEALQKMESDPSKPLNQQILNLQLQQAAETDPALLAALTKLTSTSEALIAIGNKNIQAKIEGSPGAKITIKR